MTNSKTEINVQNSVPKTNVNDAFPHEDTRTLGSNQVPILGFHIGSSTAARTNTRQKSTMFWPVTQASCVPFQYLGLRIREISRFLDLQINSEVIP